MSDTKPKIYVWCNSCSHQWHSGIAMAEDGRVLAGHMSSNHSFQRHDMGVERSDWKHDKYNAHYPDGWELVYVEDDIMQHEGIASAVELNKALGEAAEAAKESA